MTTVFCSMCDAKNLPNQIIKQLVLKNIEVFYLFEELLNNMCYIIVTI